MKPKAFDQFKAVLRPAVLAAVAADLARKLHEAGRSGYLALLEAQRKPAQAERSVVQLRGERAVTTVALVRALGGGWDATIRPHA